MEDEARSFAYKYFNQQYKVLMRLFSVIVTQLETERSDLDELQVASLAAYYTIVTHFDLNDIPYVHLIETFINGHKENSFTAFDKELAYQLLMENKLHTLKAQGLVKVELYKNGNRKLTLTRAGKEISLNLDELTHES